LTHRLLYTHPSIVSVTQVADALERERIESEIRNEYAAGAIGEIAPIDAWPELWVGEADWVPARRALERFNRPIDQPDWTCDRCGSSNPATFDLCWHCGTDK